MIIGIIFILLMSFADPIDMSRGIIKHHPLVIWRNYGRSPLLIAKFLIKI